MPKEISKRDVIGNELSFPVNDKKSTRQPTRKKRLLATFLLGYLLIAVIVFGIRSLFFINAEFTEGIVNELKKSQRGFSFRAHIDFIAHDGSTVTFTSSENLRVMPGQQVRVVYKKKDPARAKVYSFFGFWFNAVIICQVIMFFWLGILIVYNANYPKAGRGSVKF